VGLKLDDSNRVLGPHLQNQEVTPAGEYRKNPKTKNSKMQYG
jgi:hypothetical protein